MNRQHKRKEAAPSVEDAGHIHGRGFIGKMRNTVTVVEPLICWPSRLELKTLVHCALIISGGQSNQILFPHTLWPSVNTRGGHLCPWTQAIRNNSSRQSPSRNILSMSYTMCSLTVAVQTSQCNLKSGNTVLSRFSCYFAEVANAYRERFAGSVASGCSVT